MGIAALIPGGMTLMCTAAEMLPATQPVAVAVAMEEPAAAETARLEVEVMWTAMDVKLASAEVGMATPMAAGATAGVVGVALEATVAMPVVAVAAAEVTVAILLAAVLAEELVVEPMKGVVAELAAVTPSVGVEKAAEEQAVEEQALARVTMKAAAVAGVMDSKALVVAAEAEEWEVPEVAEATAAEATPMRTALLRVTASILVNMEADMRMGLMAAMKMQEVEA